MTSRLPGEIPDELPRELIELGRRIAKMNAGWLSKRAGTGI